MSRAFLSFPRATFTALALAAALQGCGPSLPAAQTPESGPPTLSPIGPVGPITPGEPESPEQAQAQRLLNELALSALRASGRVDPQLFQGEGEAPVGLNPDLRPQLEGSRIEPLEQALRAVNENALARRAFTQGLARAREYCATAGCVAAKQRVELKVILPPPSPEDALVRVDFVGEPGAACVAQQAFSLLFQIRAPKPPPTCSKPRKLLLLVRAGSAAGIDALDCPFGDPVPPDARADQCCKLVEDRSIHFGTFQPTLGGKLRCDL